MCYCIIHFVVYIIVFFLSLKYWSINCLHVSLVHVSFLIFYLFFKTNCTVMTVKSKQTRVQYLVACVFTLCVFESCLNIEQWCNRFWLVSLPVFLIIHITLHNCWWSRSCWSLINNKPCVYPGYLQICYSVTMANVDHFHMNWYELEVFHPGIMET